MVVLEDLTHISAIQTGYVECCARCGRTGIEQHSADGDPVVVHSEISEVLGDGMRVEPQDCCAVPRT